MAQAQIPFEYGVNDCALFVDSIYRKAFGVDLAGTIRGSYSDKLGAAKVLIKEGGWDGILLSRGFVKPKNINFVNRGDIVISDGAAGVWVGEKAIFAGNVFRPIDKIEVVYTKK